MTNRKNDDPNTPLEQVEPVDVNEVDEEGPQPPKTWGDAGQGSDEDEGYKSEEAPQDGK